MNADFPTPTTSQDLLLPVQEDGKLLRTRIKNAQAAHSSYRRMRSADEESSRDRARVQSMIDGENPYDQRQLDLNGLGEICNVNWGQGEQLVSMATSPYLDLVTSVDVLNTMPTNFGDPQARPDWESIMADEFTRMVRNWPEFYPRYLYLVQQFLVHGVGLTFREDEIDWRWQVAPLGDFLIPRNTRASDEEIELCCIVRSVPPHELYQKIEDEELAKELHWNVPAVKKALLTAMQYSNTTYPTNSWEDLEREFKNNDLAASTASAAEVKLVFMWAKELDGSISQYIFPEKDADVGIGFLYENKSRYKNTSEAFNTFVFGIGTNGYFHSIRGMASKIFSTVQALNRLRGRFYDSLMTSSMLMIEPDNEDAMQDMSLVHFGPFVVKPPNIKVIQKEQPNFSQSLIPGLNDLSTILQQQAGTYTTEAIFNSARQRTKFETQAQLESVANISLAQLNLFYIPWERLLRETVRRAIREDYFPEDPGGQAVNEFRTRCMMRGVPIEAILMVDVGRVEAVRAVGGGSSAARSALMERLYNLSASFDPQGRQQVLRDLTRTLGGVEAADRYTPAPDNLRPPMEAEVAYLENIALKSGNQVPVRPNTLHRVHFDIHLPEEEAIVQALDEGTAQVEQVMPALTSLHQHTSEHAQYLVSEPDYPQIKKRLQELDGILYNATKHMQKIMQDQAEAAAQAQAEAPAQPEGGNAANPNALPDTLQRQLVEASTRLRIAEEKHQQEMRIRAESAQQEMMLKDAEVAAKIARERLDQ